MTNGHRRFLKPILVPTATLGLIFTIAGCRREDQQNAQVQQQQRQAAPVTVAEAVTRDVPVYIDQIGKTVAVEVVSIVPQVGGKVIAAHVENGAYVNKGDLLFEIDPRPYRAALDAAKATLDQNEAELRWARADFQRTEELRATSVASQLEWEQKKSGMEVAHAKVEAAKAAIEQAELDLEYTKIFSPIDGRAGARFIDAGNVVKPNEGVMLIVQRLDPIYAEFTVNENDLGTVRKFMASRGLRTGLETDLGLKVEVDVPGDSAQLLSALGSTPAATRPTTAPGAGARSGTLTFLDNTVQASSGTVKLRATLPNPDRYFWPGQFVNVRLVLTTKKDAVLIPSQAQQIGQQGPFVYVVAQAEVEDPKTGQKQPATVAQIRPITAGQRQGQMLVVEQGVSAGEQVIVSGQMMVTPGGQVSVTNAAPQQAAQVAQTK
jgi:multidrug efflux system membrane fusion protein